MKCIMCYLARMMANLAISYSHDHYNDKDILTHVPVSYCNADWGNIKINHWSVSGVFFLYCGGAISWSVKTQK